MSVWPLRNESGCLLVIVLFPLPQTRGMLKWTGEDEELGEGVRIGHEEDDKRKVQGQGRGWRRLSRG